MEAAWRSRLDAAPTAARSRRRLFAARSLRRIGARAAVAIMAGLIVGSLVFAASRAAGPLYGARLALLDAELPSDPASRLDDQIANAQVRLAEASDAEAQGDGGALVAALAAYGTDAATLAPTTGAGAGRALAAVEQHREGAGLTDRGGRPPPPSRTTRRSRIRSRTRATPTLRGRGLAPVPMARYDPPMLTEVEPCA